MKRTLSLLLALSMVLALGITATAADTRTITASYRDVNLVVDGAPIVPRDATGKAVEPFIYNGTTYLPVRAVADALGVAVEWDGATSTITLTSGAERTAPAGTANTSRLDKDIAITYRDIKLVVNGQAVTPKDANGNTVEPFICDGTTYLPVRAVADALGVAVEWDGDTSTVYLGQRLEWKVSRLTDDTGDGSVYICNYTYDKDGNCIREDSQYGDITGTTTRSFDKNGNITRETLTTSDSGNYDGTEEWTYDANGNCLTDTITYDRGYSEKRTYSYDANGNMTRQTLDYDSYSFHAEYTYDENGLLIKSAEGDNEGNGFSCTYTYDDRGNCIREELLENGERSVWEYTYDDAGRRLTEVHTGADFTVTKSYTYTADGKVLTYRASSTSGWTASKDCTYDELGRLVRCIETDSAFRDTDDTYVFDDEGNLVEQIWTLKWSDGADQGVVRFTYDKGNKLVRKDVSDTVWYEYTYDQYGNQLTYGNDKFLTTYEYVAIQR